MIGSGSTLARFQAKLGLDSTDYAKGMINAESVSRIFGNSFSTFVSNPLLGSIGILKNVSKAFVAGSTRVLAYAEDIERLSQQTGVSEGLLIALEKRLEIAGFSAERAAQSMAFFNKFISDYNRGGKATNDLVNELGVNLDGLSGTDELFTAFVESISKIEDPAEKSAAAMQLFGRMGGPELINAIGGGSDAIDEMVDQYTQLGFVVNRKANSSMAGLNTTLGFTQQAIEGVQNNFIVEFLLGLSGTADLSNESIITMTESLNSGLTPAAHQLGEKLGFLLDKLESIQKIAGNLDKANAIFGFLSGKDIVQGQFSQDTGQRIEDAYKGYVDLANQTVEAFGL